MTVNASMQARAAGVRTRIHAAVGQVVLALTVVPRDLHQSIADLQTLVLEPLMRDRIATSAPSGLSAKAGINTGKSEGASKNAVDEKIREQIKAGAFPIHLKPEEWASGDKIWLLGRCDRWRAADRPNERERESHRQRMPIAPSQKMASSVLANFKQVAKQGEVRIHPVVARQVDPELLRKMGAVADGGAQ